MYLRKEEHSDGMYLSASIAVEIIAEIPTTEVGSDK